MNHAQAKIAEHRQFWTQRVGMKVCLRTTEGAKIGIVQDVGQATVVLMTDRPPIRPHSVDLASRSACKGA